jgi:hypothetical protein
MADASATATFSGTDGRGSHEDVFGVRGRTVRMVRRSTVVVGAVGVLALVAGAWSVYQRRTTETAPYTVVAHVDDVELRRYPPAVLAETEAASETAAFRRLFRYISGANEGDVEVSMTAPVEVSGRGTTVSVTTPVAVESSEDAVRMAFYLPGEYDVDTAPRPSDDAVELVAVPPRTLAVRGFSWLPTERRVARESDRLVGTLEDAGVATSGEPFFLGYDAPWTLPFLRRNEVAVEVEAADG